MLCPYFNIYHNEIVCNCVQEKVDCLAIVEKCEHKLGKKAYEDDLLEAQWKN